MGDRKWNLEEASDILVTVSEELNIIVPGNDANPAVYIDVPLNSILEVSFDTDSQKPTCGLVIQLMGGTASNCIINATGYAERHLALAFASEKDANTLRRLLRLTNVRTNGNPPHSQSGAIVVSEPILSDDELAASGPALSNSQSIMDTASLANAIIPHRNPVNTINPSMLERVHTFHRASAEHQERSSDSMVEHDEDPQTVGHCVEMAAEGIDVSQDDGLVEQAIEGIDVSQADGLSLEETHNGTQAHAPDNASSSVRFRYSQALSGRSQETMGHFDRTSDTGPLGSLRSHMDVNAIQNAPEFRARLPQQFVSSVEPVENINRLEAQDRGYDDLYDASPKVKDGRRRSPRIIARDSIPPKLERALGSTGREASVKTGPPTKLSRQLRNDNGVLEPHTEQIANDGLATLTKNRAADVKTSANSKKRKPPVPAKVRKELKESTNPTKKTTQGKTKLIATEESPNASFDNYDLPPSPTRARSTIQTSGDKKKTTTARLKATKAPCNNQKQAKLETTKAAATISPKSPAPRFQKGLKNKAKANGSTQDSVPQKPSGEKVDNDADAIWDVGQAHSKENPQSLRQSRRPTKLVKRQEVRVSKIEKNRAPTQLQSDGAKANKSIKTQTQAPIARVVKVKPAPAALSQPRIRRTAAIKANNRIQGLDESDEIVDDEATVIALTRSSRHASSGRTNAPENQKVRDGRDDRPTSSGKLPTTPYSKKDFVLDSGSLESSDEQRPNLVSEPKANSSLEKVHLVKDAPAEALRAVPGDTKNTLQKKNLTHAAETSQTVTSLDPGHGEHLNQRDPISVKQGTEVSEARVDLVPDSVPQLHESITETRPALTRPKQDADVKQGHNDLDATTPAGPGNQTQAEHVLPCIDDLSHELDSKTDRVEGDVAPSQAPPAPMVVDISQRRTSPRLAEAAQKRLPESIATRCDPFGAKLNSLLLEPNDISAKITSREDSGDINVESEGPNTPSLAGLARSSKEPRVGAYEELETTSVEEAKQIENPRRHLKSLMQIGGEHKDSLSETLELAGESMSTPRVEAKRKFEQLGNTSHKRVKLAHRERLEGVAARRKSAEDAKKTPPPVVSNRPLLIGFSTTGPRNQGTISSKAPKPPKGVGTGAHSAVELRKYDAPNTTVNQVEAGLISVREALDVPSDHIQQNLKNGSGAPKKARGSPQRKQAEYLTQAHRAQKRKLAPFLDESAPWEHGKLSKRQKRDIVTPPTAHNHHPKMLPDPSPAVVHDRSQRLSSQNTRVNEKGSPMPFWITRRETIAAEEQYSDEDDGKDALAEARLEEQILLHDDDPILLQPFLPLRPLMSAVLISQPKTTAYQSLSNNSKQVPSSPHAPSAFGTMPPHHIYHDGEIVNAETKESIIPIKPQDPFLDATENTQNPFMNALRKSTEVTAKRTVSGANNKRRLGAVVMRLSLDGGEDPEKTLVEPNLRKHKQFLVSDSSSNSQSGSSTQASQPDKSSEEESDAETDIKWRKGLEPYQENTLECLLSISHVSKKIWHCLWSGTNPEVSVWFDI